LVCDAASSSAKPQVNTTRCGKATSANVPAPAKTVRHAEPEHAARHWLQLGLAPHPADITGRIREVGKHVRGRDRDVDGHLGRGDVSHDWIDTRPALNWALDAIGYATMAP
jgi:hypothetical protein